MSMFTSDRRDGQAARASGAARGLTGAPVPVAWQATGLVVSP